MPDRFSFISPSTFDWNGSPPLSSFRTVSSASILYIIGVVTATHLSRRKLPIHVGSSGVSTNKTTNLQWKPWFGSDLQNVQFVHNVNLVLGSAIMLGGVIVESIRRMNNEDGSSFLLCEVVDEQAASGSLYYWTYVYYLSKYYELFDTFLQLARGKPPPHFALHVYHHAAVLFMAWAWCEYKQSLQFIGLAWNTAVHVVMYTYFLQRTISKKVPKWKSFVTLFQIIQFAFSIVATAVTMHMVYIQNYECSGMGALFGNIMFNITLLHSFINVLRQGKKRTTNSNTQKSIKANM